MHTYSPEQVWKWSSRFRTGAGWYASGAGEITDNDEVLLNMSEIYSEDDGTCTENDGILLTLMVYTQMSAATLPNVGYATYARLHSKADDLFIM